MTDVVEQDIDTLRKVELLNGLYTLYEDGRVYSHPRKVNYRYGLRTVKARFLKHRIDSGGYRYVGLYESPGNVTNHRIHRLLMLNFSYKEGCEDLVVNHIDGDPSNNSLSNLEWCTVTENTMHSLRTGLRRLTYSYDDRQQAIELLRDNGWSNAKIGRAFGKTPENIGSVLKTHGHTDTQKGRFGGKLH